MPAMKHRRNGVAFILNKSMANTVLKYNAISDRVISIRLQGSPVNITVIQVYAPTTDAEEEDVDQFYNQVQDEVDRTRSQDMLIIMGDFNAKVGHGKQGNTVGNFGLGNRNEAGDRLVEFCTTNQLLITNTQHHKRRLYTWTSPNSMYKNQIDYICVCQRRKSSITSTKTKPGADCGSDHELLSCKVKIQLRKRPKEKTEPKLDFANIPEVFWKNLHNRFAVLNTEDKEPEELKIIEERRQAKARGNKQAADDISKMLQRVIRKDKEAFYQTMCKEFEDERMKGRLRAAEGDGLA